MSKEGYVVYHTQIDRTKIREDELTPNILLITDDKEKAHIELSKLREKLADRYGEEEIYDSTDEFVYDVYRETGIAGIIKVYS